jgi:hypothetical protein
MTILLDTHPLMFLKVCYAAPIEQMLMNNSGDGFCCDRKRGWLMKVMGYAGANPSTAMSDRIWVNRRYHLSISCYVVSLVSFHVEVCPHLHLNL